MNNHTHPEPHPLVALRALMPHRPLTETEAVSIAERQAAKLVALAAITEPPVPELVIAYLPRVKVERRQHLPMSGYTEWSATDWHIVLNHSDAPTRQRFSLAHEFKHLADHPFAEVAYAELVARLGQGWVEHLCDYFAACLLMPKPWVKQLYCNQRIQDVEALARSFAVSPAAMWRRLVELGLIEPTSRHGRQNHWTGAATRAKVAA